MRVLALDIGEKRIGVAISDPSMKIATPLEVVDAADAVASGGRLKRIVDEYEPGLVVVGLPITMEGAEGPQARRVRGLVERLARFLPDDVEFVDERLTSVEASRRMREGGVDARRQRGAVDMVAAAILLQEYLDARSEDD